MTPPPPQLPESFQASSTPSSTPFDAPFADGDLRGRTVRGGVFTMFGQSAKFVLSIAAIAVLGRLLTPADFGLIAMVLTITGLAELFKDLGLGLSTVQRATITHEQISTLYWVNIGIGFVLAGCVCAVAPFIVWFFGDDRLLMITFGVALSFVFAGATVQPQALLRRRMSFGVLTVVQVSAMAFGVTCAVIAAVCDLGYWALVIQILSNAVANMIGVTIAARWWPGRPSRHADIRHMLLFGGELSAANILNYAVRNTDNLLIGRLLGDAALGYYTRAYQLLLLPIQQLNNPLNAVALPALSRCQDDPVRFRLIYRKGMEVLAACGMPIVIALTVTADRAVVAVLGDQWHEAVRLFQLLAPAALLGTFNVATGWVYIPLARTRRLLMWSLISTPITVLGFVIGLRWGAAGVAAAFSITMCAMRLPGILYCLKGTFIELSDVGRAIGRPFVNAMLAGMVTWLMRVFWTDGLPDVTFVDVDIRLMIDLLVYTAAYTVAWVGTAGGRRTLRSLFALRTDLRRASVATVPTVVDGAESDADHG
jgi:PST family polysaccharide transporter